MLQRQHETEWFPEQTFPLNIHTDQVHWISGLEKMVMRRVVRGKGEGKKRVPQQIRVHVCPRQHYSQEPKVGTTQRSASG